MQPSAKSLSDAVGFVLLVNHDPRQIEADYIKLIEWESKLELY